jgi:hypothetical protein
MDLFKTNLQESVDNATVGTTGGVSYEELMMKHVPNAAYLADPNKINDLEEGKWGKLFDQFTLSANTTIPGIALTLYELGYKEPEYIPLRDPQFTSLPIADQIELAPQVKDAVDSTMLRGYIHRAEKNKAVRAAAEAAATTGERIGADILGSLWDPSTLLAFQTKLASLSVAGRIAVRGAEAGGITLMSELGRQKTDPTVQNSEVALNGFGGVLLGSFLGSLGELGRGFSSRGLKATEDMLEGRGDSVPMAGVLAKDDGIGAARYMDQHDFALLKSNGFFNLTSKILNFGQELDGLNSPSSVMNKLTSQFTSHAYTLKGNLKGMATPQSILNVSDAQFNYRIQPAITDLDGSYVAYKKEGGKLNQFGFFQEVRRIAITGEKTSSKAASEGAQVVKKYFKNIADDMAEVDPEFKARKDYYPNVYDRKAMIDNPLGFKEDLKQELLTILRREEVHYQDKLKDGGEIKDDIIPANPEDLKFKEYVTAMYEKMYYDSGGFYHKPTKQKTWSNQHLEQRLINFSPEFVEKYTSKDLMQVLRSYGKKTSKSYALMRETGLRDPYKALDNLSEDYLQLEQGVRNSGKAEDVINKELINLNKNFIKDKQTLGDLIDLFTQNHLAEVSSAMRNTVAVAKAHTYLTLMGGVIASMITDAVRVTKSALETIGLDKDILKLQEGVASAFKFMSKEDAKLFGVLADKVTGVSRATMWADLHQLDILTNVEKATNLASGVFSNLNLMNPINDASRTFVGERSARFLLGHAKQMVEGKLDPKSALSIELNRVGMTPKMAQQFLDNFAAHKETKNGVVTSGIDDWSHSAAIDMISLVQRSVNNNIIVPTNGSRPMASNSPIGSLAFNLKGFLFASTNKFLLPALQNMAGVNPDIALKTFGVMLGDFGLAAMISGAQQALRGQEIDTSKEAILNSILTRNATFAILGLGNDAAGVFGYGSRDWLGLSPQGKVDPSNQAYQRVSSAAGLAAGPFARSVLDAGYYGSKYASSTTTAAEEANARKLLRLIPGQNLLYWNWALQAPIRNTNNGLNK